MSVAPLLDLPRSQTSGFPRRVVSSLVWLLGPWLLGAALAGLTPTPKALPLTVRGASHLLGWVYFAAWSVSFYPQLWLNFKRKSKKRKTSKNFTIFFFSCSAIIG